MLNYIWGFMFLFGIITAFFNGRLNEVTNAVINGGKDAVSLAITMLGIIATWTGIMKIAEKGGMIKSLSNKMEPLLKFLFPDIPKHHLARQYIATNLIANFLGLGWAATPAGLKAMKELNKLNKDKTSASKSMCMFMIINMSSVQLITVNVLAYRAQYLSKNPSEIIITSIIATIFSTIAGIVTAKFCERWYRS